MTMASFLFSPDRPALCARCEERALEETFRAWQDRPGKTAQPERAAPRDAAKKTAVPAGRAHAALFLSPRRSPGRGAG